MSRRKNDFPQWFKMAITILPVSGFVGVLAAVAFGVSVSPLLFTPLVLLTGAIIAQVLGLVPKRE